MCAPHIIWQLEAPNGRKQLRGTVTEYDPDRKKCWYLRFEAGTDAVNGTGEWGILDKSRTLWITNRIKRPILGLLPGPSGFCGSDPGGNKATVLTNELIGAVLQVSKTKCEEHVQ